MNKQFEQHLQQQLEALPEQQQPEKDLWRGIELAINQSQPYTNSARKRWYAMAASLLVVGFAGWLSWQMPQQAADAESLATLLSSQHQQQKQALLVSFKGQQALTNNWQEQLLELDDAAEAIKKALQQEPDNPVLLKMLQQVYQQQIDLIETVHAPKWQQI